MRKQIFLAAGVLLSFSLSVPAALVTLYSVKTSDTDFEIRALASPNDNYGLACFNVTLDNASYTEITNYSPCVFFFKDGSEYSAYAGFSLLRSANGANPVNGGQATLTPANAIMVYGIGQTAGSLSDKNPGGYDEVMAVQKTYDAAVILVKGKTAPGAAAPSPLIGYNPSTPMVTNHVYASSSQSGTFANVFTTPNGVTTAAADVILTDQPVPTPAATTPTPTPEDVTPPGGGICPWFGLIVLAGALLAMFLLTVSPLKSITA